MRFLLNQTLLTVGYVIALIWVAAAASMAVYAAVVPLPQQVIETGVNKLPMMPAVSFDTPVAADTAGVRDPFIIGGSVAVAAAGRPLQEVAPGLRVRAVIVSLKSGVVIEDSRDGSISILSEGESAGGVLVRHIARTGVMVEVDGKQISIPLAGGLE